jgi:hypothetical protein
MRTIPLTSVLLIAALLGAASTPAPAQKRLTTLFAQNNSGSNGWGVFYDLNVTAPNGVWITSLESNVGVTTPITLDFYTCPTTYLGNQTNPGAWTLHRTAKGLGMGPNGATVCTFAPPVFLQTGSYGVALYANGFTGNYHYTNGTGSNQVYSNADLTITCGEARAALFSSTQFTPRVWNGTIVYDTTLLTPPSFVTWAAPGCTGSNGAPTMAAGAGSAPKIGAGFQLAYTGLPLAAGPIVLVIGASRETLGAIPLPFALGAINMTGCNLYVSIDLTVTGVNLGGTGLVSLAIPGNANLLGQELFLQTFVPDALATGFAARVTNAGQAVLGL